MTLKLVGFTAVVNALADRLSPDSSLVLFGGMAKERPYPGPTTVSTVNGGIVGLTRTLVEELKPIRVNAIHPGVVGDSPRRRPVCRRRLALPLIRARDRAAPAVAAARKLCP